MATTNISTAAEILADVIRPAEPKFASEFALHVLDLRLSDTAQSRVRELLQRGNAGVLSPDERQTLDHYLLVGEFIDLIQAQARVSLQTAPPPA